MIPAWQRAWLVATGAIVGFTLVYLAVDYAHLPHLVYFPDRRVWRWLDRSSGLPMGYVGQWLDALAGGIVCGALTLLRRKPVSERTLGLATAWAATAFLVAAGWFTWQNW